MSKNEIVLKAKQLDEVPDCNGVVDLLGEYIKENADDLEALALFQKNLAVKIILDLNLNIDDLYSIDEKNVFNNIPEELVLKLSETMFIESISNVFLLEKSEQEKEKLVFGYLYRAISSLGDRLEDYNILRNQLEKFFETMSALGYGKYFYSDLSYIVDWKSKVSENILKFLVEKSKSVLSVVSDKKIYDTYTKNMKNPLCSFEDKPYLSGGRLVIVNIKSEEEKEFWKGYFSLMKNIREEEYESYRKISSDENNPFYGVLSIGENIHKSYMNAMMKKIASSEDVAKMQVATNCDSVSFSESDFKSRIETAEQSINTIKVNPIEQIKSMIFKLLGRK